MAESTNEPILAPHSDYGMGMKLKRAFSTRSKVVAGEICRQDDETHDLDMTIKNTTSVESEVTVGEGVEKEENSEATVML